MKNYKKHVFTLALLSGYLLSALPGSAVEIDTTDRWQVRDFYHTVYPYGSDATMDWSGNYDGGNSGTVSADWLEATRVRVNFFRAMAGVPDHITFDDALNAKCQDSSLIMSANNALSHYPPQNWQWWTQDGYDAANNGNLAIGSAGAESIDGYMVDFGGANYAVGHRRWLLYPQTTVMGSGDVPGNPAIGIKAANTLWVIHGSPGPRPETRDDFVAWPPAGHVPSNLVFSRWSFSYPNADFSNATVSMQSSARSIKPPSIELQAGGIIGEPTIVWVADEMDTNTRVNWPTPEEDEIIEVSIGNVSTGAGVQSFNYTVTIFDAKKAGDNEFRHEASVMGKSVITAPTTFGVTTRPWSQSVQGRVIETETYNPVHGAEGGANPFVVIISAGYAPIQSGRKATGSSAFHLAHPDTNTQFLLLPDEFLIENNTASLDFDSSLAVASDGQSAHVDINLGSGDDWREIWSESGPVGINDTFTPVSIDLSPWAGLTARFRFRYQHESGKSYYPQTDDYVGWAFDNVALSNVRRVSLSSEFPIVEGSSTFQAVFEDAGTHLVQGRSFAFDGFSLNWGPVIEVTSSPMTSVEVPFGGWSDDPVLGWLFGADPSWKYSLLMGYIYVDAFPWIYTQSGWLYYSRGSVYNGLWLYHANYGFSYTQHDFGGWFQHSPFTANAEESWNRFTP